jgi:GH15 family glucan-1,4-alpha-glucosidase
MATSPERRRGPRPPPERPSQAEREQGHSGARARRVRRGYDPIGDYGVIGDLNTVALVGLNGSIDFMCFPDFDSPSVFAALLDARKGGHFQIAPVLERAEHKQLYLPDTCMLLTRFLAEDGLAEISDFMPVEALGMAHNLVRRAKTVRGEVRYRLVCDPRFDYGRAGKTLERVEGGVVFKSDGPDGLALRLRSSVPLRIQGGAAHAEFTLGADQTAEFVLELATSEPSISHAEHFVADAFKQTMNFWHAWIGRCKYEGRWREMVQRSALTLKMLFSARYGSLVAAPTFGLPEVIGGERNWDYRYTWIRDASFTLYALIRLGYTQEAGNFIAWLSERCCAATPGRPLQIMYGLDGREDLREEHLDHFEGYMGSQPVRIGNGAYNQLQLDIYGELLDSVYLYDKFGEPISHDLWLQVSGYTDWVCENWRQKDLGIWESRGEPHQFLHSRVMCWVALDRALRMARRGSRPGPVERWRSVRDEIYGDVYARFWNEKMGAFVQRPGSETMDASCLLLPLMRFVAPRDPRWRSTLRAVEERLVEDSLVHRYRTGKDFDDGLFGSEGTFNMCTFWYVECLSREGDLRQARLVLEKMLGYANHLGLYAEELGWRGEQLGNFPQAFTHLSLISAAYDVDRRLEEAGVRD